MRPTINSAASNENSHSSRRERITRPAGWFRTIRTSLQRFLSTLAGLARLAVWRIRYYTGLSLLALIGVTLAVGLVTSAAFFAQAVDQVMLNQELDEYTRITRRPPFAARVFTPSTDLVPLNLARAEELGERVRTTIANSVGLPAKRLILQVDSGNLPLLPPANDSRYADSDALTDVGVVYLTGVAGEIEADLGAPFPGAPDAEAEPAAQGDMLSVWMHADLGAELGLQIGDQFVLEASAGNVPVQVAGLWQPRNPDSAYWLSNPNQTLRNKLLVPRAAYTQWMEPALEIDVRTATWQIILDEEKAVPSRARNYKAGFDQAGRLISRFLPNASITAPTLSLEKFVGQQTALTTLLLGFNVPALGFLLYFLILTSAVIAYWQRRETSLLRSRGITRFSILNFTLIEATLLFLVGTPLGLLLGLGLARAMGYSESFLTFAERAPLPVSLSGINLPLTLATLAVVLTAKLWTVSASANHTIVTQSREQARPSKGPFWYRNYLDLILIIPTVYAYQQFIQQGSLGALVQENPDEIYQDPLLILVPGLFIITFALLSMRFFPLFMRLLDSAARWMRWFPSYLALRQLGRQSQAYINPLLLVIVSLALGVYTLSMAASMDQWLQDRVLHRVGADIAFTPFSESEASGGGSSTGAEWIPPIDEFKDLPSIEHAARVGDYEATIMLSTGEVSRIESRFLAIDRLDFPLTAWFRSDFARESLGGLMNRLATVPNGVLVSQDFLEEHGLRIGDRLSVLVIPDAGISLEEPFTIVGTYEYFPTVSPDEVVLVGNLDHIISFFGVTMPHRIWLNVAQDHTISEALDDVPTTGVNAIKVDVVRRILNTAQAQMERVGVFGTLTVSFLAAALMAALGLLTYSYASLHERLFQFSVLRAVGLRRSEIISQVALEYGVLTAYGALAGVACGALAARLFVPLFRVSSSGSGVAPPLIPIIAQSEIIPLAVTFAVVMIGLELLIISSSFYNRLFEALRMGHQG